MTRSTQSKRPLYWAIVSGMLVASTAGAAYIFFRPQAAGNLPAGAQRPVPVTTGVVTFRDFPIYRVGIGTVQAYNTVTVRVRVDGEVQTIAFQEGQDVRAGDLLAQIDPRTYEAQLHQAEADKARDVALLANAKLDFQRYSSLAAKEYASRQSVDTQSTLVAQYEAAIQHDEAAIDNAKVSLSYTRITSPIDGRTGMRLVDQGNIVHASDSTGLVVVTQLDPIFVIFTLPQGNLPEIAEAMRKGELTVIAYDQNNRTKLGEGKLSLIDNQIDQGTGSLRLKAIFPNKDHTLWPGQFVNAWLQLSTSRGPVVPDSAIQSGPDGSYAFAVRPDGTVEMRTLNIVASHQGHSLVSSGLAEKDRIVVDGHYRLRTGARIAEATKLQQTAR